MTIKQILLQILILISVMCENLNMQIEKYLYRTIIMLYLY